MSKKYDIPWGEIGYIVYKRTYSRKLNNKSDKTEEYEDTIRRVIQGSNKQLKVGFTKDEESRLEDIMLQLKGTVAGRFFWQLGTKTVDTLGLASLQNCAATVVDSPIRPFTWAMDMLMLGSGVGYRIQKKDVYKLPKIKRKVKIERKDTNDADFIIPDSRQGWIMLLEKTLRASFYEGKGFTYSTVCIRGKGEPIKGFGGTASGPNELCWGMGEINKVLNSRSGKSLRPIDCLDIMNIIGAIVVAGNVRRSAQIAIGDMDDFQFLNAKNWEQGNIPSWRAMSNNSVVCNDISKLPPQFWDGYSGNGEPYGLINLNLSKKVGRSGEFEYPDLNVVAYNPCVTGDTPILTDTGYFRIDSLLDKKVNVWNGFEFSEVEPKITGYDQSILEIQFSNGRSLKCTPYHKFVISTDYRGGIERLEAINLTIGDKLIKHNFPIINSGEEYNKVDMYTQGFYSGDGVKNRNLIWLYEPKYSVESFMNIRQIGNEYINIVGVKRKCFRMNFDFKDKSYIPFEADIKSRLSWLSGVLDSDGCELKEGGAQIGSVDKQFLLNIQKLLTTCGVHSKVLDGMDAGYRSLPDQKGGVKDYYCNKAYRICIGSKAIQDLKIIGLETKRLKFEKSPNRDASRFVTVTSIKELEVEPVVYCFTESKRNLGCFDGIVTGQCAEQSLENYETCCLAEIHLPNIESKDELKEVSTYLYRINKHSLALQCHHPETEEVVHRNMRMGIGITGYAMATEEQKSWLSDTYEYLREFDKDYSKKHGFNESIKLTTVKPSGTLSLLSGVTPGAHPGFSHFYIRRVRMDVNSNLVQVCRDAGYPIEFVRNFDGTNDTNTVVIEFPAKLPKNAKVASEVTAIDQLETIKELQTIWSDNAVSVTIYYKKEELDGIKKWLLNNYNTSLKTVSFLLHSDHGFDQAPMEEITEDEYNRRKKNTKPISNCEVDENSISSDQIGCTTGACPIK